MEGRLDVKALRPTDRFDSQIRGPKWVWRVLAVANSSFSVAYFVWGRHKRHGQLVTIKRSGTVAGAGPAIGALSCSHL